MKKVSLVFALFFGLVAASFAQIGQGKCAWNAEKAPDGPKQKIVSFDMVLLGIADSEGDPAYSVSLTADFGTGKASKVMLTEIKSGKKWLMNQLSPMTTPAPISCNAGQGLPGGTMVYKSALTNMVVYASVPLDGSLVAVYLYKPSGPQEIKTKF